MDKHKHTLISRDLVKQFAKWEYDEDIKSSINEAATRDFLIEPFFNMLGYEKRNNYSHEYSLQFSKGHIKKVDMVITLDKKHPIMLVECKKASENIKLNKHFNQLAGYYNNHKKSKIGILTNGIVYRFYAVKWNEKELLNDKPFLIFDLNDFTRADLEDIAIFHRDLFDINSILAVAEEQYFLDDFEMALIKTLHPASNELSRIISKHMGAKQHNKKISSRIINLVNSISLQDAVEQIKVLEGKESSTGVYTTANELKAFQIVKTILALKPKLRDHIERVTYVDRKGHFKIDVDNMPSKEICRFDLDKKEIGFGKEEKYLLREISATEITKHKTRLVNEALKYLH
tara:strand:- start:1025 stop:2059 length:1035 start_codon:yes stop_codon:yes gene_type:complete